MNRRLAEVCLRMSSYSYRLLFTFFDGLTHFGRLLTFIRRTDDKNIAPKDRPSSDLSALIIDEVLGCGVNVR